MVQEPPKLKQLREIKERIADEQFDASFAIMAGELSRFLPALFGDEAGENIWRGQ